MKVLIDASVMMDVLLPFRERHQKAQSLIQLISKLGGSLVIPGHAYFEYTTALITHYKHQKELFESTALAQTTTNCPIEIVTLSGPYVDKLIRGLMGGPLPDLKSQDLIYFCVSRDQGMTLITEDKRLRNVSIKGGLTAWTIDEAIENLQSSTA
jgi:hypothetical protein